MIYFIREDLGFSEDIEVELPTIYEITLEFVLEFFEYMDEIGREIAREKRAEIPPRYEKWYPKELIERIEKEREEIEAKNKIIMQESLDKFADLMNAFFKENDLQKFCDEVKSNLKTLVEEAIERAIGDRIPVHLDVVGKKFSYEVFDPTDYFRHYFEGSQPIPLSEDIRKPPSQRITIGVEVTYEILFEKPKGVEIFIRNVLEHDHRGSLGEFLRGATETAEFILKEIKDKLEEPPEQLQAPYISLISGKGKFHKEFLFLKDYIKTFERGEIIRL